MRRAVVAATLAFGPKMRLVRGPVALAVRRVGRGVIAMLDRRRRMIDDT